MPEAKTRKGSPKQAKNAINNDKAKDLLVETKEIKEEETHVEYVNEIIDALPQVLSVEAVKKPLEKDIMKTEPVLTTLITSHYEGERNEDNFYHGEGHAVFNDGMIYKGMFENGKMHGYGVFSWPNGTVYSGDFVYNVLTGKGQYSWSDGSSYDGDVVDSLRHGYGTFKCLNSSSYTGQWKHGKRHGKGILYYDNTEQSYYDGDWVENEKCGYGKRQFSNGNIYIGNWLGNVRHGIGHMYWYNIGQEYNGNWHQGIQHGQGENIWYLKRVGNTQYPLRNHYIGNFSYGEREGKGAFYYASGAIYEGDWKENLKHGYGKFTFKNGSVFKGIFQDDHMADFPDLILSGMTTPDITRSGIPLSSPLTVQRVNSALGIHGNSVDAFLDVDIDDLLVDYKYDLEERQEEIHSIIRIIMRFTTQMKHIYKIYSCLGLDSSVDNTFVMSKLQYIRFLKDYEFHRHGFTITEIERSLYDVDKDVETCFQKIFIRDFLNRLIRLSAVLYENDFAESHDKFSKCFGQLVDKITQKGLIEVKGIVFHSSEMYQEFSQYINQALEIYFYFLPLNNYSFTMRNVLLLFKEFDLINDDLTATLMVKILTKEDKSERSVNLSMYSFNQL